MESWKSNDEVEIRYRGNDVVKMILNMKDSTLKYAVNNVDVNIGFTNIVREKDLSYRMAVRLWTDTSLELLFCQVFNVE